MGNELLLSGIISGRGKNALFEQHLTSGKSHAKSGMLLYPYAFTQWTPWYMPFRQSNDSGIAHLPPVTGMMVLLHHCDLVSDTQVLNCQWRHMATSHVQLQKGPLLEAILGHVGAPGQRISVLWVVKHSFNGRLTGYQAGTNSFGTSHDNSAAASFWETMAHGNL